MKKNRDVSKERYWREVIRRQATSGETVAHFCAVEGVPTHQFYWWKRTLRVRDRQSTRKHGRRPEPQIASDPDEPARQDERADSSFVPVRFPWMTDAPTEVVHSVGYVVRVPTGFHAQSLYRVLATLDPSSSDSKGN